MGARKKRKLQTQDHTGTCLQIPILSMTITHKSEIETVKKLSLK